MKKRIFIILGSLLLLFTGLLICVPKPLFKAPCSTVVFSQEGKLLGARIAADQQWRFPELEMVPEKYKICLVQFEDRFFYYHPGINVFSLARALFQNIKNGKIISGGSTLTMQVCRMAREQKSRNITNKVIEMIWALNLELRFKKSKILNLYASHAPFGGNVVGLDAASWRYFSRSPSELSWAESATLAVLPNAPSLIYPGRSDLKLKEKRDRLLAKLLKNNAIDSLTFQLSIAEPVPEKVHPLPANAYHLIERAAVEKKGQKTYSTIDFYLQNRINELVISHHEKLKANHINNMAVLVSDIKTHQIKAYVGNFFDGNEFENDNHVDIIQSPRSTGSILKPFLYAKMLDEGLITPKTLIPDVPTRFGGFTPMNFDQEFNGAVSADEALARSLNIPAVKMLQQFGVPPFYNFLKKAGMSSLTQDPDYYGLSLILGGAEITLWDLAGMYTSFASILKYYSENDGAYRKDSFTDLLWEKSEKKTIATEREIYQAEIRAASVYSTLNALLQVKRPDSEAGWEEFTSARNIAWKTGTSFGFRDAWAIGVDGDHVVSVWIGNADGEGRPGLTGINCAAPLLFDIFGFLPNRMWFDMPIDEMEQIEICPQSGFRRGAFCDSIKQVWIPKISKTAVCPWHSKIHLNENKTKRVSDDCYPVSKMTHKNYFVLTPAMEYYFKPRNPWYSSLPPIEEGCAGNIENMEFIYPRELDKVYVPKYIDGMQGQVIFEVVHRQKQITLFWHLDENFIGKTNGIHQFALNPTNGWHTINVTDNHGNQLSRKFEVVSEK